MTLATEFSHVAAPKGWLIDLLFAISVGLLFTSFQVYIETEWVTIRFYPTIPIMVLTTLVVLVGLGRERPLLPLLSLPLLAFAVVHVLGAFRITFDNGVRELVQAAIVFAFVSAFAARYATHPLGRFFRLFLPIAFVILGYTIIWHLSQGYFFQWKRLGEPKALFDLLPLMVGAWIWSRRRFPVVTGVILLAVVAVLILLSGERKAYVAFGLLLLLMINPKHPMAYLAPMIVLAGLYGAVQLIDSPYVTRQVQTLLGAVGIGPAPETISGIQRAWQLHVGLKLFDTAPLFGIGTNGFSLFAQQTYAETYIGLHGEFLRILVENGLVGLTIYGLLIAGVVFRLIRPSPGAYSSGREHRIAWLWFLSLFVYTSFEGANQLLMVLQYSLAYLPLLNFSAAWRPPYLPASAMPSASPEMARAHS